MAAKKCPVCIKTVYPMEAVNWDNKSWHKLCFKCHECAQKLTLTTFKGVDGRIYCEPCRPKPAATQTADRHDLNTVREAPKVATVNDNVRGELAGQAGKITSDSMSVRTATQAPKVSVTNEQVRGELAGQGGSIDMEAMGIKTAVHAPKVSVTNEQVRGELAGQGATLDMNALGIRTAVDAPKAAAGGDRIKSMEEAGQTQHTMGLMY